MKPDATKCQLLVESMLEGQNIIWPVQIPVAQKLISFCDDLSFWLKVKNDLDIEIYSLKFFLSAPMKKKLTEEKKKFFLDKRPKKEYILQQGKIGEDTEKSKNKIKTLKDFLKNG